MTLRRNIRASVLTNGDVIQNNDIKLTGDDKYFIYMKNVNLKSDGIVEGRYLGEASDNMIDGYCRDATYVDGGFMVEGKTIRTAKMVAVKNDGDNQVIVVIQ